MGIAAVPMTHISPGTPVDMPQKRLGDSIGSSLYTSASCMDLRRSREDDDRHPWHSHQRNQTAAHQQQQGSAQLPYSSPLPQTQWTDVPPVYRPADWVDPDDTSPVATRQSQAVNPMSAWRALSPAPSAPSNSKGQEKLKKRKPPRIFRKKDTAQSSQQQPFDVTMLYPQLSPYEPDRMSIYSAPEQLERPQQGFASQPNSPGFAPNWSALPSRSEEPSPVGIPRSPTYPPAGRRRMHTTTGRENAAFEDEHDFRLFVEATAGLPPDLGFSLSRTGQSPTQTSQSPIRRAATTQATGRPETSPIAETPSTMFALREMASIPQANQTYRPQRASQQAAATTRQPYERSQAQNVHHPTRSQTTRSDDVNRERLAASASGLDLWLPSPISPEPADRAHSTPPPPAQSQAARHTIPPRAIDSSNPLVSPMTPATRSTPQRPMHPAGPLVSPLRPALDREIERQLEELDLELDDEEDGGRDFDDELPDYAQSQAEAQAERRVEAARRARELQERWLRRGR